jgi:hypothetical protein
MENLGHFKRMATSNGVERKKQPTRKAGGNFQPTGSANELKGTSCQIK